MISMIKSLLLHSFPILSLSTRSLSNKSTMEFLDKYDAQQVALLYEPVIVVDREDRVLGQVTKKDAHLLSNIEAKESLIHRAFSFFLFDNSTTPSRLILQQRSSEKITYPSLWANTCCSHPLYNKIEMNNIDGVKHAVIRRVKYELGYEFDINLIYLAKIFYQARNIPDDGIFGESEIDYIIIGNHSKLDLLADFKINQNEVKQIQLVTLEQCEQFVKDKLTTPWFTRIVQTGLLAKWWKAIDQQEINKCLEKSNEIIQL